MRESIVGETSGECTRKSSEGTAVIGELFQNMARLFRYPAKKKLGRHCRKKYSVKRAVAKECLVSAGVMVS
jgi:hypothetical protein